MAATLGIAGAAWLTVEGGSLAQDAASGDAADQPSRPKARKAKSAEKAKDVPAPAAPAVPPPGAVAPAAAPPAPAPDFAARFRENGAGTCASQVDALAATSMGGVAQFNTLSNWAMAGGDRRAVSLSIGQRYPAGNPVPYGATTVMAAPNGQGSCDAFAVQVVPSPLPCDRLRETLAARGRQVGDLAGVAAMQDPDGGQTLLVPTGAGACVLVGLRSAYAK